MTLIRPLKCSECPIRHSAVCSSCTEPEFQVLESAKTYRSYAAGAMIAEAGEQLFHLSSVVSGVGTMSRVTRDGRRHTVGLLLPSDFIGRPGRSVSAYDVEAVTEVTLCCFERRTFERLMAETPNLSSRLLELTLDELDAARDWALVLGRATAREKVAGLILRFALRGLEPGAGGAVSFTLPLTREALADYLGLTLETVSRQFSALRRDGVIAFDTPRAITVPSVEALGAEAAETGDAAVT